MNEKDMDLIRKLTLAGEFFVSAREMDDKISQMIEEAKDNPLHQQMIRDTYARAGDRFRAFGRGLADDAYNRYEGKEK